MNTKRMVFISLFAAFLCILSPIAVPVGTIPVTLSLFALFVTALVLQTADAVTTVLIYILIGATGLPVFSGWRGGIAVLAGATGGYIIAYPFAALTISYLKNKSEILSLLVALIIIYFFGTIRLSAVSGISFLSAAVSGVVPFVIFDIAKIICALFIGKSLKKACASFYKFR